MMHCTFIINNDHHSTPLTEDSSAGTVWRILFHTPIQAKNIVRCTMDLTNLRDSLDVSSRERHPASTSAKKSELRLTRDFKCEC